MRVGLGLQDVAQAVEGGAVGARGEEGVAAGPLLGALVEDEDADVPACAAVVSAL